MKQLVGSEYFSASYRPVPVESSIVDARHGRVYYLNYEYLPFRALGESESRVTIAVPEKAPPYGYVATLVAGEVLEPRISRSQAIAFALNAYFAKPVEDQLTGTLPRVSREQAEETAWAELRVPEPSQPSSRPFWWRVSIPELDQDRCGVSRVFLVSAIDGTLASAFGESYEVCE
jgi:hypothetical protein